MKDIAPDLQSSLLCDDVRQERNGKFILIGLFDALAVPSFPTLFHKLCLENRWCCGQGEFKQRSRLLTPDDTVLIEGKEIVVSLQDTGATATSVEYFLRVKLETAGVYWVEIILDGDLKLRYPLRAVTARPAKPGPVNPHQSPSE
ncbi:MAG: hypothetical protein HQ559_16600 [Lentisphaerae bacterium]|nr:hypothetical protein [Lentisphaerota bacterium]